MIIAGVDAALSKHGVAFLDTKTATVATALFKFPVLPTAEPSRTATLLFRVWELCSAIIKEKPEFVVIEGFSFGSKQSTSLFELGAFGYTLRGILYREQIPFCIVPPTVLKQFVAGRGNADKSGVAVGLYKQWQYAPKGNDLVDATGLAVLGYYIYQTRHKTDKTSVALPTLSEHSLTQQQVAILKKLEAGNE